MVKEIGCFETVSRWKILERYQPRESLHSSNYFHSQVLKLLDENSKHVFFLITFIKVTGVNKVIPIVFHCKSFLCLTCFYCYNSCYYLPSLPQDPDEIAFFNCIISLYKTAYLFPDCWRLSLKRFPAK